ncbi:MAG: hypothetical protein A2175_01170 [Candidatus Nealsonbacteria bacterium RBG_13_42_11]|uniref:Cohesin domain-containing protein n=1 Tax=Candidatus Nealsonbacteria bacterium RBG_13_42_11 TaxID=1801663 RepID=A0A1G2DZU0_9BACT|nr:MAG: hypothetical protein A2175_01170 [Candidatus Nealsonbacteria bacterium RBG_13_42_11]
MKKIFFAVIAFSLLFFGLSFAEAATLYLSPAAGNYNVGNSFSVSVILNTAGATIGAAEAEINFPSDKLNVNSISKDGSVLNLWVVEPTVSGDKISFKGGKTGGFSGSGAIFVINFQAKAAGSANVSFLAGGRVLTFEAVPVNVLTGTSGGTYNIAESAPPPPPPEELPEEPPVEEPPPPAPPGEEPVPPVEPPEQPVLPIGKQIEEIINNPVVQKIVQNPVTENTVKTVVSVGVGISIVAGMAGTIPFTAGIFLPYRIFQFLGTVFSRKKKKYWGVVYDSFTKQPLDPVYLVLKNKEGTETKTKITDLNGRFGFLVSPGEYYIDIKNLASSEQDYIEVRKTRYKFPSTKIKGSKDELYDDLYHGELIKIKDPAFISINIPLDPVGFNWNEIAKKEVSRFNYHWELFKRWFPTFAFYTGLVLAFFFLFFEPNTFNITMGWVYIGLFALRSFGFRQKSWGLVLDKKTKKPLAFSIIKVFPAGTDAVIQRTICDKVGRYFILAESGVYDLLVEEKKAEEYQPVKKYSNLITKTGVLNKDLFV